METTPNVILPAIFADGMVIQRDRDFLVWGWTAPSTPVSARLETAAGGEAVTASATSTADGTFAITMPAQPAGTGAILTVSTSAHSVHIEDVSFGEIWVVGGQSNAQLPLRRVLSRFPKAIEDATDTAIRVFQAPEAFNFHGPQSDCPGMRWIRTGIDDVSEMSALAYFFANRLRANLDVPVGIIATGLGGTPIEAWLSEPWLRRLDLLPADYDKLRNDTFVERIRQADARNDAEYDREMDEYDTGLTRRWNAPEYDDADWSTMRLTDTAQPELRQPGVIWIRGTVRVPREFVGKSGVLNFGTMQDADEIYVNGTLIGQTGYQYPPRIYRIDHLDDTLQITIRLKVHYGTGGLTPGKTHTITVFEPGMDAATSAPLGVIDCDMDEEAPNIWRFKRSMFFRMRRQDTFFQYKPAAPYNAVLAPWGKAHVTGFVWYQGESNTYEPRMYGDKLVALAQCWRELFATPNAPFIAVQLPNLALEPFHDWPRLRNEQRRIMTLVNTALVTTADVGEDNDLHPTDKLTVAERAATAAMALAHHSGEEPMGPFTWHATLSRDNAIFIHFLYAESGLRIRDGYRAPTIPMTLVSPSGHVDMPLAAEIADSSTVRLTLPQGTVVPQDAMIRYAWEECPDLILENQQGLPASPFEIPLVREDQDMA